MIGSLRTHGSMMKEQYGVKLAPHRSKRPWSRSKQARVMRKKRQNGTIQTTLGRGRRFHPGFKAVQAGIAAKSGISSAAAGRILASSTRRASAAAKRRNPRLRRVK